MLTRAKAKRWGNSIGIVIPSAVIEKENIKPEDEVEIMVTKKTGLLSQTFGLLKGKIKKPTDRIMREIDEELWGM